MSCFACEASKVVVTGAFGPLVKGEIVRCTGCGQLYRYDKPGLTPVRLETRYVVDTGPSETVERAQ